MKYEKPNMDVYLLPEGNVIATSDEGFTPGQGGGGGKTPLGGGTSTVDF